MTGPKVHLAYRRKSSNTVTACGLTQAARLTRAPSDVTCDRCRHTLVMADAEVHSVVNTPRGRRINRRRNTD